MIEIKIDEPQENVIEAGIRRLQVFMQEDVPSSVMDEALAILLSYTRKRFLNETAPDGSKWQRSFAAIKREETGRGGGTLFDTGRLFHSIQILNMKNNTGQIYTDVPYARKHQDGEPPMPARQFIGIGEEFEVISAMIRDRMEKASNGE